jgi:hypothetical protein
MLQRFLFEHVETSQGRCIDLSGDGAEARQGEQQDRYGEGERCTGGVHKNEGSVIGVSSRCATVALALCSHPLQRVVSRAE